MLVLAFQAQAQPPGVAACMPCHGAEGQAKGTPPLAGQPQLYLVRQLDAYADGRRQHDAMTAIAEKLTPQQRAALGEYFSKLPIAGTGAENAADKAPARGRLLATSGDNDRQLQACANCHGPAGIGREPNPYLAGLDTKYLAEELQEWKAGRRKTDPSGSMDLIARNLSRSDVKAVAAYYAAQEKPPQKKARPAKPKARGDQSTGAQGPGGAAPAPADKGKQ
jgi:cytochrome c553